jgi:hypothetical protein
VVRSEREIVNLQVVLLKIFDKSWIGSVCCHALNFRTSTQLTISASTHKIKITTISQKSCMTSSTINFLNFAFKIDFFRRIQTVSITMAQLSVDAETPRVNVTVFI